MKKKSAESGTAQLLFAGGNMGRFVTRLDKPRAVRHDVEVAVFHTEKMTDACIGNKAFKLSRLQTPPGDRLLSFGGAWSNHLHALSYLCHQRGVDSVGVVRAEQTTDNVLLQSMRRYGMHLHFVSRAEYRRRNEADYCADLCHEFGCSNWLPEGGSTDDAVIGCRALGQAITDSGYVPTMVVLPVGTGATLAGIVNGLDRSVSVVGLPVVRDDQVKGNIQQWVGDRKNWSLHAPLSPGYAKVNDALVQFVVRFHAQTGVILDPVYSGKALMHCMTDEFLGKVPEGGRVLFIHTGGLMGNYGFLPRYRALAGAGGEAFLQSLDQLCALHLATGQ